jgi:hypothetical protein
VPHRLAAALAGEERPDGEDLGEPREGPLLGIVEGVAEDEVALLGYVNQTKIFPFQKA